MNIIDTISTEIAYDIRRIGEFAYQMGLQSDTIIAYEERGNLLYVYLIDRDGSKLWDDIATQVIEFAYRNDMDYSEGEATITIDGYDIKQIGNGAAIILYIGDYYDELFPNYPMYQDELDAIFYLAIQKV